MLEKLSQGAPYTPLLLLSDLMVTTTASIIIYTDESTAFLTTKLLELLRDTPVIVNVCVVFDKSKSAMERSKFRSLSWLDKLYAWWQCPLESVIEQNSLMTPAKQQTSPSRISYLAYCQLVRAPLTGYVTSMLSIEELVSYHNSLRAEPLTVNPLLIENLRQILGIS